MLWNTTPVDSSSMMHGGELTLDPVITFHIMTRAAQLHLTATAAMAASI